MGYRRRWKPNAAQKAAYKAKMEELDNLPTFTTQSAIRKGCYVKYYNVTHGRIIEGVVTNDSYGKDKGQHTFTIDGVRVKGRNLYPRILEHVQGDLSKQVSR